MAERKRLGLIFTVNPNWMGGTYYILNLINSFNYLEDENRPTVILLCSNESDYKYAKEYTNYPYLEYQIFYRKLTIVDRIINKISWTLLRCQVRTQYRKKEFKNIDIIYPIQSIDSFCKGVTNIGWIPDFQDKYLPDLFLPGTLKYRETNRKMLRDLSIPIVFSSKDAKNDYIKFYGADEEKTAIYRFTSKFPALNSNAEEVLKKYNVEKDGFFFCGNQFWIHKNHTILFEAIKLLKENGYNPVLLCTGNPKDNRTKDYFQRLLNYIQDNRLQDNIRILGLIDRNEQLTLMQNCKAVVQPSLFEGWNTSIEEAKAMNKMLIVSDLNVHKEQVLRNGIFFKRNSAQDLAEKIGQVSDGNFEIERFDYSKSIKESAETFIKIIEDTLSNPQKN